MDKKNINVKKLVNDIKIAEAIFRNARATKESPSSQGWLSPKWKEFCAERGIGRFLGGGKYFHPQEYSEYVTELYTLRAWLRGKCHRLNAPEDRRSINHYHGRPPNYGWDVEDHNGEIAMKASRRYLLVDEEELEEIRQTEGSVLCST